MPIKYFSVAAMAPIFCFGCASVSKPRVVVSEKLLKIQVSDDFPKDLTAEIYVGPSEEYRDSNGHLRVHPFFKTKGENGRLRTAALDVNLDTTVSILRKDTEEESYVLYLFSHDNDGKIVGLFDLDMDGNWDVKEVPTPTMEEFIFLQGVWSKVDKIGGLRSKIPNAIKDNRRYEFHGGTWTSVP